MAENQTTDQSEEYKYLNIVDRVGEMPGSNREANVVETVLLDTVDADILSDSSRDLGAVSVIDATGSEINPATDGTLSSVLSREIATWSAGTLPVEQQTPVGVEDTTGTQVDPATQGTLAAIAGALASNATDTLQVDQQGVVDISSRDARNLGDVDVTALPDANYAEADAAALSASATNSYSLAAEGADQLDGRVKASGSYDVEVEWQLSTGTVVESIAVASAVTGGTWTDLTGITARTPYAVVKVTDTSAAAQTTTVAAHLR